MGGGGGPNLRREGLNPLADMDWGGGGPNPL